MKFDHNYNLEFDKLINDAEHGQLGKLSKDFLRPAYYGTSLSGIGTDGYHGQRLVARLNKDAYRKTIHVKSKKER